jgi:hypothetical protein
MPDKLTLCRENVPIMSLRGRFPDVIDRCDIRSETAGESHLAFKTVRAPLGRCGFRFLIGVVRA